jgi:hypothetical protein
LAQPMLQVAELPDLWQDRTQVTRYEQQMCTAVGRLVSMATYSLGGVGVQCYVNPAQKVIGWVVLTHVYLPIASV